VQLQRIPLRAVTSVELLIMLPLHPGGLYDLGKADARLQPGARYTAVLGSHKLFFKVHGRATTGKAPIVSKLLRFPAS